MKNNLLSILTLAAACSFFTFTPEAQADSKFRVSGHFDSGHHRHIAQSRHVCKYKYIPIDAHYYDDHGHKIHYTEYEKVRVCKHKKTKHHRRTRQHRRDRYDSGHVSFRYGHGRHGDRYSIGFGRSF